MRDDRAVVRDGWTQYARLREHWQEVKREMHALRAELTNLARVQAEANGAAKRIAKDEVRALTVEVSQWKAKYTALAKKLAELMTGEAAK